ncbi:MAG: EAL domain-containing protein [Clostridia bacterium]
MENEYRTPKIWILVAVISIIVTLLLGHFFITSASDGLYREEVAYLEEISIKSTDIVKAEINGYFSTLEALSTVISSQGSLTVDSALAIMRNEAERGFFKRMGIILPNGIAYTTDGYREDFNDRTYFYEAMTGKNAVSDCIIDKIGGEEINVFASPVYKNNIIVGVIFATKSQNMLSESMVIESFGGKGYSYLITGNGTPVIKTNHPDSIGEYSNFFDTMLADGATNEEVSELSSCMFAHETGAFEYMRHGIKKQMFYSPVGINDWYVLSVVPSEVISLQSDQLIQNLGFLILLMTILAIVISYRMILVFRCHNKRLHHIAYTDSVTGHPNWAGFRLGAEKLIRENPNRKYAMIAFDINKFKLINDLFGYQRGNEILQFTANILAQSIGKDEIFCRAAADLFNILMIYENDNEILKRLKLIEDELEGCIENYKLKISIGICTVIESGLDVSARSDKANISRNIAKKQNTINYHFFEDENRIELLREKEIENIMDMALEQGEFQVYLQPKYLLKTDKIVGAEALVRWKRPESGLILPCDFIPLFEKNGFIRKLDMYMFESVCRLISRWMIEFPNVTPLSVSVNISRAHLSNPDLSLDLLRIASCYGVPPALLEIELTESAIFENVDDMSALMERIKLAGFLISIDDFGSGYSSLASLKSLCADIVKIDKSFLDEAENDQRGKRIICGMVDMIRDLGMLTVAEGVETLDQKEFLKIAGCDIMQGYYMARPMPVIDFEALVFKS